MNTRLQVEHPVTEMITGVDLVEQMIRMAAGEKLSLTQDKLNIRGWAIESRIYAEDPYRNFLPSIGRLVQYRPPTEGSADGLTVRNDTGVYEGGEISIYYDPMIAKLVTHAPTRPEAIAHMAGALDAFYIDGIQHNIPFLAAIMHHPRWQAGDLSTGFIAEEYAKGFAPRPPEGNERDILCAVAAAIDHLCNQRRRQINQQMPGAPVRFAQTRVVNLAGRSQIIRIGQGAAGDGFGEPLRIEFIDEHHAPRATFTVVSDWWPGQPIWSGTIDGRSASIQIRPVLNGYDLTFAGINAVAHVYTQREAELAALMPVKQAADTSKKLLCPMPGLLVSIAAAVGQEIKAGEPLCVVEAMKMENILRAERDVVVKAIHAKPGDSLAVDAVIMDFA
jgi:propionyl-CoA carboxylase alpha chain